MSIIPLPTKESQTRPKGLRVLRQKYGFLYTVERLDQCCDAHPCGCGHEDYCRKLFDVRCDRWTYTPSMPKPTSRCRRDPTWIPILNLRNTLHSMRRLAVQEG